MPGWLQSGWMWSSVKHLVVRPIIYLSNKSCASIANTKYDIQNWIIIWFAIVELQILRYCQNSGKYDQELSGITILSTDDFPYWTYNPWFYIVLQYNKNIKNV